MNELIKEQLIDSANTINAINIPQIKTTAQILTYSLQKGHKILLCGNGGSASDCQHFAAELIIRFRAEIKRPSLPAVALTANTSVLTAAGNDIGFENIFAQQIYGLGATNDVLIAISTSGNSKNIINAIIAAKEKEMKIVGLLGKDGGEILNMCDEVIVVENNITARIQEAHITIMHIWCDIIERFLYPDKF